MPTHRRGRCSAITRARARRAARTCTNISLMMLADSSPPAAAPRAAPSASNSSMKSTAGAKLRSMSNVSRMRRAPTPV
jgi:hypothetical protein